MAKKKSKKKASKRGPSTITIVLPAQVSESDRAVLEGIADLLKAVDYDTAKINFVSEKDLNPNSVDDMQANQQGLFASC